MNKSVCRILSYQVQPHRVARPGKDSIDIWQFSAILEIVGAPGKRYFATWGERAEKMHHVIAARQVTLNDDYLQKTNCKTIEEYINF